MPTTKLETLRGQVAPAGRIVDRTYPLEDAAAATRHLVAGQARGEVVVAIAPTSTHTTNAGSTP